jgi:hypothetical protein
VEIHVGSARGTQWPTGSSAGRMVARKARRGHGQEPVQGSGSRPKSANRVCGDSPQNRQDTWLSHKTKTGGSASGDRIQACEKLRCQQTRGGIVGLTSRGRGLWQRNGRAMKRSATRPICP